MAAHIQLLFTYFTSLVFYVENEENAPRSIAGDLGTGLILILANCGAFFLIFFVIFNS